MMLSKKIILAMASLVMLVSCGAKKEEAAQSLTVDAKPTVYVEKVFKTQVPQVREFTATVEAFVANNIAPQTPMRIKAIFVEVGDHVVKGQKLVQMDANNLIQAKVQLDNIRAEFNRMDELYKIGGISKSQWDAQKANLEMTETSYKNLIENTTLLSPITGIVTARNYDAGDLFGQTPILTVEQINPVKLAINVSETYFRYVKKGMPVDISLDVYGDEKFEGQVSLVYPTIDPATRTFTVEITIKNTNERVRPGMFARATLNFGTIENVMVPDLAVIKQAGAGDRFVYVVNSNGTVSYRQVELGQRFDNAYELLSGVEDGESVVVAGQARLKNGIAVNVEQQKK